MPSTFKPSAAHKAADFIRVPGKARNYALKSDPDKIISRRQYDQVLGRYAGQGLTLEKAASKARKENPQLAETRPARGRKKPQFLKDLTKAEADKRARIQAKIRNHKKQAKADKRVSFSRINFSGALLDAWEIVQAAKRLSKKPDLFRISNMIRNVDTGNETVFSLPYIGINIEFPELQQLYETKLDTYGNNTITAGFITFVFGFI